MNQIEISRLYKYFGDVCRLQDINMEIAKGESCVIIGGSGSGKSVLIKSIVRLIEPNRGSIKIDGVEILDMNRSKFSKVLSKMAFLFQGNALFDSLPVWKNVAFELIYKGKKSKKQVWRKVEQYLSIVGLQSNVMNLYPNELSGGMQKRVAIARTLISEPEIIFFDEPTSGLDPINTALITDLLVKCNKEMGITIVTITHDLNSAYQIANQKMAVIFEGKLLFFDNKNDLKNSHDSYVQKLISCVHS